VKRKNGAKYDLVRSYTYNDKHQPLTVTDARGATTSYNLQRLRPGSHGHDPPAEGHAQGATTVFTYEPDGYLRDVSGPVPGAKTSFTYDAYGRRRTMTDAAGLVLTYDYDALDRVTRVTWPDATYEETVYKWLDAVKRRDRLGRWTETYYDALRQVVAVRDAAGNTTSYQQCACGSLEALIDANGNRTSWEYDLQGRVVRETRADGSSETFTYETSSSRLKQRTDRKGVTTGFEYFVDGQLKGKTYSDATPPVAYTYDP